MRLIYLLILPILIVVSPIVFQTIMNRRRIQSKTMLPIWGILLITMMMGLIMSGVATYVSVLGLTDNSDNPDDFVCATGAGTFLFFGLLITIVVAPVNGLIGWMNYKSEIRKPAANNS